MNRGFLHFVFRVRRQVHFSFCVVELVPGYGTTYINAEPCTAQQTLENAGEMLPADASQSSPLCDMHNDIEETVFSVSLHPQLLVAASTRSVYSSIAFIQVKVHATADGRVYLAYFFQCPRHRSPIVEIFLCSNTGSFLVVCALLCFPPIVILFQHQQSQHRALSHVAVSNLVTLVSTPRRIPFSINSRLHAVKGRRKGPAAAPEVRKLRCVREQTTASVCESERQ